MPSESLLEVRNLSKTFGSLRAVDDVSVDVGTSGCVGVIGPNGSGKTTLFNLVSGAIRPDGGSVSFDGDDVTKRSLAATARRGLVRTFQSAMVFPGLSVRSNVESGRLGTRRRATALDVDSVLRLSDLGGDEAAVAADLPYGKSRRLNVAVALAASPRLLMLDEPAAGLNDDETAELQSMIERIVDGGVAVVVIEHDIGFISRLCERVLVLNAGTVLTEGTPSEVRTNPDVIRTYLGDRFAAAN